MTILTKHWSVTGIQCVISRWELSHLLLV